MNKMPSAFNGKHSYESLDFSPIQSKPEDGNGSPIRKKDLWRKCIMLFGVLFLMAFSAAYLIRSTALSSPSQSKSATLGFQNNENNYWDIVTLRHAAIRSQTIKLYPEFDAVEKLYSSNARLFDPAGLIEESYQGKKDIISRLKDVFVLSSGSEFAISDRKVVVQRSPLAKFANVLMIGKIVKAGRDVDGRDCVFSLRAHVLQTYSLDYLVVQEYHFYDYEEVRSNLLLCNGFSRHKDAKHAIKKVFPELRNDWMKSDITNIMWKLWDIILSPTDIVQHIVASDINDEVQYFATCIQRTGFLLTSKVSSSPSLVVTGKGDSRSAASGNFAYEMQVLFDSYSDILYVFSHFCIGVFCFKWHGVHSESGDISRFRIRSK